jgi:hypothetical protein
MAVFEIGAGTDELTPRQRWNHYFALIFGVVAFVIGVNLRISTLNATTRYTNSQVGITAEYPQNWLIDESPPAYIFRVRDPSQTGFKTTFQVAVSPVSGSTSARNILDALSMSRAPTLDGYRILSREPFALPDETAATAMSYTFVATETNPFLESIPVVVEGLDILTITRGQAIIITFLSDASNYDSNFVLFEQFLQNLRF